MWVSLDLYIEVYVLDTVQVFKTVTDFSTSNISSCAFGSQKPSAYPLLHLREMVDDKISEFRSVMYEMN